MDFINIFQNNRRFSDQITHHKIRNKTEPVLKKVPDWIHDPVRQLLCSMGLDSLYIHQVKALNRIYGKENIVLTTGVSSGKSLCYQIPILENFLADSESRSLLLFPTKALTRDQQTSFQLMEQKLREITQNGQIMDIQIYDGDTPSARRSRIRKSSHCIFTNPDMLHLAVLPHHPDWNTFFENLKYIVIDEIHIYRGVFGSHFANVIRRLKRVTEKYGAAPEYILTSATISNVREFAARLIEEDVTVIDTDGSPGGIRNFYLYNPPLLNRELGIRQSASREVEAISGQFAASGRQVLVFTQSRRSVELLLKNLRQASPETNSVQGYRSGYLPEERRKVEKGLRNGAVKIVISTNALEMGIDIGSLDVVVINGYPGSIASTIQQAGRAGRSGKDSDVVLVASSNLLDQYILQHPEYIFDNPPEEALINPDNPFILLQHIQCAAFEIPFQKNEPFGSVPGEEVQEYLQYLTGKQKLHSSGNSYFWISDDYPAGSVSLRTTGITQFVMKSGNDVVGVVDDDSAYWFVHQGAVYLHNGDIYIVREFDPVSHSINLVQTDPGYYTVPERESDFDLMELYSHSHGPGFMLNFGEIRVTNQTIGFKKIQWNKGKIIGFENVDLPKTSMVTHGTWMVFNDDMIKSLESDGLWNNKENDYGPDWENIRVIIRARDQHCCAHCGKQERTRSHDVHHKIPFKSFSDPKLANEITNLVTLCHSCHMKAEKKVRIQSGLSGLSYIISSIAPLHLMCDRSDIHVYFDPKLKISKMMPAIVFYDSAPGGIGLSKKLYELIPGLLRTAMEIISSCPCQDGCPACTGPVAENGEGAKNLVRGMLIIMSK